MEKSNMDTVGVLWIITQAASLGAGVIVWK